MKSYIKKALCLIAMLCMLTTIFSISASASTSATVSASSSSIKPKSTVTVTVKFSATSAISGVDAYVSYDSDVLEFVSGDSANGGGGSIHISGVASSSSSKSLSYSLTFKGIKAGSSSVKISQSTIYNWDEKTLGSPTASTTVTVKSSDESLSKNANLKYLRVSSGTLSPSFSANTVSYSVTVPNDVTRLLIYCDTEDSNAKQSVQGSADLKVGQNTRSVKVTAPAGNTKTYTINITRKAASGSSQTSDASEDTSSKENPLEVVLDGSSMTVATDITGIDTPKGFLIISYTFNDVNVPALLSKNEKVTLLYLKGEDDKGDFYIYDNKNISFNKYTEITVSGTYAVLEPDESISVPSGFKKSSIDINSKNVTAFVSDDSAMSDFAVIYAMNRDGESGLYLYDTKEGTIQRYIANTITVPQKADDESTQSKDWFANLASNGALLLIICAALAACTIGLISSGNNNCKTVKRLQII